MNTQPHEVQPECIPVHCVVHKRDEFALRPFLVCPRCNHTYATKFQLKWLYRRHYWPLQRETWVTRWQLLGTFLFPPRADQIPYCPVCSHDFEPTWHCLPAEGM